MIIRITTAPKLRLAAVLIASSLALAGCVATTSSDVQDVVPAGQAVTMTDGWVKSANENMSAAFGELVNASDQDVTVVSATTEASSMVELHETVENESGQTVMRQIEGGFVIPAGGAFALEPGGNHLMLMGLSGPLMAGDDVTFTLTFSDDSTYEFTAPVKDYSGANETYDGGSDMDMGSDH